MPVSNDDAQLSSLTRLAEAGDERAFGELLNSHRQRLRSLVDLRMDRRLRGRVDASDVIQEAFLEAAKRRTEYVANPSMPFFLWLRFLVCERLVTVHRHHADVRMRDVKREVSLWDRPGAGASTIVLAEQLVGSLSTPSQAAMRAERSLRVQEALNEMQPIDREIIALRHFEQLSRDESAQVLQIEPSAASKRYIRSMRRLRVVLEATGESFGGEP